MSQSQDLAWPPRTDGTFLVDNPLSQLAVEGKVANIPFIVGVSIPNNQSHHTDTKMSGVRT